MFVDDPPPYKDGVRINSPHYLCKLVEEPGTKVYTLVVSQYEKSSTTHYTLRVYSTADFTLTKVPHPYKYEKEVSSYSCRIYYLIYSSICFLHID